jgi:hypothetical protein
MSAYLKYLSAGFEILGMSALGFFLGRQADSYFSLDKPWLTTLLTLVFSLGGLIVVLRRFLRETRQQDNRKAPNPGKATERL